MERFNGKNERFETKQIFNRQEYLTDDFHELRDRKCRFSNLPHRRDHNLVGDTKDSKCPHLPPIDPGKKLLITPDERPKTQRRYWSFQAMHGTKEQGNHDVIPRLKQEVPGYVPFDTTSNGERSTKRVRDRHPSSVLLSSSLAGKLKSGTVHYKNILPPIGETYKIRAQEYYSSALVSNVSSHPYPLGSDTTDFTLGSEGGWLEDFFETMRRNCSLHDEVLASFLASVSAGRRNAICDVLDYHDDTVGAVELLRHRLVREIISMYF